MRVTLHSSTPTARESSTAWSRIPPPTKDLGSSGRQAFSQTKRLRRAGSGRRRKRNRRPVTARTPSVKRAPRGKGVVLSAKIGKPNAQWLFTRQLADADRRPESRCCAGSTSRQQELRLSLKKARSNKLSITCGGQQVFQGLAQNPRLFKRSYGQHMVKAGEIGGVLVLELC